MASDAAIQGLVDSDYYTIGRISTLHDSLYAYEHMTDAAVCQLTGFVWYDTNSTHWLAPEKQAARQYVTDIVTECGKMGFDELLLDDFHYPREGRMSRIKTDERTIVRSRRRLRCSPTISTPRLSRRATRASSPSAWTRTSRLRAARQTPAS